MDIQIAGVTIAPRVHRRTRNLGSFRSVIYVHPRGETLIDNLINRRSRPIKLWREQAVKALTDHKIEYSKLSWRQNAGCPCGCSPGFIAEDVRQDGEYRALEIWVDVEEKEVAVQPE